MSARAAHAPEPLSRARTGRAGGAAPARGKNAARAASRNGGMKRERLSASPAAPLKRGRAASVRAGSPVQTP